MKATRIASQEKRKELKKENEGLKRKDEKQQCKIKSLKELSELTAHKDEFKKMNIVEMANKANESGVQLDQYTARAEKLDRVMSDKHKKVNMVKLANKAIDSGVQ
ncbi:hypothetical protein DITRI_Ditri11bG0033900 [Diplodiscus trichospermus]